MYTISVIVPIYKVEKYIEKCLLSLFSQTLHDIEFIFINDNTPDSSMSILYEILERFPKIAKNVKVIENKINKGSAYVRNLGISLAQAEYIIFCDSDDWVDSIMYEEMYNLAIEEDADIVYCDYWGEYLNKAVYYGQYSKNDKYSFLNRMLDGRIHNGLWNKLIRKKIYDSLDLRFVEGLNMWEDVSILPRLSFYANRICYINKAFYHYNQTNIFSYTMSYNTKAVNNIIQASEIIVDFFKSKSEYKESLIYFKIRTKYLLMSKMHKKDIDLVKCMFPECDKYIFKHPGLTVLDKICYVSYLKSFFIFPEIVLQLKNLIKKLMR